MYKPMSYSEIRSRIQTALEDPSDPDRLAVLDTCCRLMAALVLGAETALMTQVSAPQRENLRTLLHHLTVRYPEEICLLRAAQDHHAAEIRRHGVPEDVVHAALEQRLCRNFYGSLRVPELGPELPWGIGITPDAFLTIFPGAG